MSTWNLRGQLGAAVGALAYTLQYHQSSHKLRQGQKAAPPHPQCVITMRARVAHVCAPPAPTCSLLHVRPASAYRLHGHTLSPLGLVAVVGGGSRLALLGLATGPATTSTCSLGWGASMQRAFVRGCAPHQARRWWQPKLVRATRTSNHLNSRASQQGPTYHLPESPCGAMEEPMRLALTWRTHLMNMLQAGMQGSGNRFRPSQRSGQVCSNPKCKTQGMPHPVMSWGGGKGSLHASRYAVPTYVCTLLMSVFMHVHTVKDGWAACPWTSIFAFAFVQPP